jgi:hypothetical protein
LGAGAKTLLFASQDDDLPLQTQDSPLIRRNPILRLDDLRLQSTQFVLGGPQGPITRKIPWHGQAQAYQKQNHCHERSGIALASELLWVNGSFHHGRRSN